MLHGRKVSSCRIHMARQEPQDLHSDVPTCLHGYPDRTHGPCPLTRVAMNCRFLRNLCGEQVENVF